MPDVSKHGRPVDEVNTYLSASAASGSHRLAFNFLLCSCDSGMSWMVTKPFHVCVEYSHGKLPIVIAE